MNQPIPELQVAGDAYASSIERLEQHAERLSFTSDLAKELRRLNEDQKYQHDDQLTTSTNPVTGLRPKTSGHRSQSGDGNAHFTAICNINDLGEPVNTAYQDIQRSTSIKSGGSATELAEETFARSDGTHAHESEPSGRGGGIDLSTHNVKSRIDGRLLTTSKQLLFYPAPVPMVLDLPRIISAKRPIGPTKNRIYSDTPQTMRRNGNSGKSPEHEAADTGTWGHNSMPECVAAKDASTPTLQRFNDSATKALERLLDASVHASVEAFTEHPITRSSGIEAYRSAGVPGTGNDTSVDKLRVAQPGVRTIPSSEEIKDTLGDRKTDHDNPQPDTLLAELDARKKWQHSRNKSAADNFPEGVHATLLQLDEVAQVQRQKRKIRPTTLVWESNARVEEADARHEDNTPVALLARSQNGDTRFGLSVGLQEQKYFDDNELLSIRRARLKEKRTSNFHESADPMLGYSGGFKHRNLEKQSSEEPSETLAQRKRRMHIEAAIPIGETVSGDLSSELLSAFNVPLRETADSASQPPDASLLFGDDETLAQRQKRLHRAATPPVQR